MNKHGVVYGVVRNNLVKPGFLTNTNVPLTQYDIRSSLRSSNFVVDPGTQHIPDKCTWCQKFPHRLCYLCMLDLIAFLF